MARRLLAWGRANRSALVIFFAMGGVYFFTNFQRAGVPGTIFNEIQNDFGVSAAAVTALAAIFLYVYAGMQVFIGAGADRFGPARMILTGGALLTIGAILFPLSSSMTMLYLSRALVGLGASFMYISIIKEIVLIFPARHFAALLGVLIVVGYSGGLAAQAPLQRVVARLGWRSAFLAAGLACAVVYLLVAALLAASGRLRHAPAPASLGDVRRFARTRAIYPLFVCGPINFAMYYVIQIAIGKKFLEDYCRMDASSAADTTSAMLFTVIAGSLIGGFLPRLVGDRRKPFVVITSFGVFAGCAALAAGVLAAAPAWWFVACYILLGVTNATAIVGTTLLKESSPPSTAAFAIGVLNGATYAAVAIVANASGLVLDAFKGQGVLAGGAFIYPPAAYRTLWLGMTVCAAVSVVVSFFAPETRGIQRESDETLRAPAS